LSINECVNALCHYFDFRLFTKNTIWIRQYYLEELNSVLHSLLRSLRMHSDEHKPLFLHAIRCQTGKDVNISVFYPLQVHPKHFSGTFKIIIYGS
jgi:hypothetical protein